jgi:hypothetical protein
MSNGGFIGKRIVPTALSGAVGVWNINEAYNARFDDIWPELAVAILTDFLIIGGGGGGGVAGSASLTTDSAESGGGAGGYLNSYGSEASGGNSASLNALELVLGGLYSVSVGAGGAIATNGSNTTFGGLDFNGSTISLAAIGGGAGGDRGDTAVLGGGSLGGSGGGGGYKLGTETVWSPGSGTANQGNAGGVAVGVQDYASLCSTFGFNSGWCEPSDVKGGGGGGAKLVGTGANSNGVGGEGLASSITGSSVTRAAGGSGRGSRNGNSASMPTGSGSSSIGGGGEGGSSSNAGGDGIVILRYPNTFSLTNPGGGLTITTATNGNDKVSSITAGSGNIEFGAA